MRISVLAALVLILAFGCGPSQPRSTSADGVVSASSQTAAGNPVYFAGLDERPEWRDEAVALIDSAMAAHPSVTYMPLTFYVLPYPLRLRDPIASPFDGSAVLTTTSFYDVHSESVYLSWFMAGPTGQPDRDHFSIGNATYELANVRCHCESALAASGR